MNAFVFLTWDDDFEKIRATILIAMFQENGNAKNQTGTHGLKDFGNIPMIRAELTTFTVVLEASIR